VIVGVASRPRRHSTAGRNRGREWITVPDRRFWQPRCSVMPAGWHDRRAVFGSRSWWWR